jgi:hypothetical protein
MVHGAARSFAVGGATVSEFLAVRDPTIGSPEERIQFGQRRTSP